MPNNFKNMYNIALREYTGQVRLAITGAAHGMGKSFARNMMNRLIVDHYLTFKDQEYKLPHIVYLLDCNSIDYVEEAKEQCENSVFEVFDAFSIGADSFNKQTIHDYVKRYLLVWVIEDADVSDKKTLPDIEPTHLFNNAGIQEGSDKRVIETNLLGVMNCTERYALENNRILSVLNQASVSAHTGSEFSNYVASKGGILAYTKAIANELAPRAICNSISFGGVKTHSNNYVIDDKYKWKEIMSVTPMKKWVTCDESSKYIEFLLMDNTSITGQDLIVDNGEMINSTFVW